MTFLNNRKLSKVSLFKYLKEEEEEDDDDEDTIETRIG